MDGNVSPAEARERLSRGARYVNNRASGYAQLNPTAQAVVRDEAELVELYMDVIDGEK